MRRTGKAGGHRPTGPFLRCPRLGLLSNTINRAQGLSDRSLPVLPGQAEVRAWPHSHAGLAVIAQSRGYDSLA
jgi:hypothetical protein